MDLRATVEKLVAAGASDEEIGVVIQSMRGGAKPDVVDDAGEQFVRGINRGINSVVSLPGEIVGGAADLLGFEGDKFRWNNAASEFMTSPDRQPQTGAGRIANMSGQAVGASAIPYAGMQSQAARIAGMAPRTTAGAVAQRIAEPMARTPLAAAGLEATSAASAGAAAGTAREANAGPVGEAVAGLVGGMAPGSMMAATGGVRRGLQRARASQGEAGARTAFLRRLPRGVDDLAGDIAAGGGPRSQDRELALRILGEEMVRNNGNPQAARSATVFRLSEETGLPPQQAAQEVAGLEANQRSNPLFIGEQSSVSQADDALRTPTGTMRQPEDVNLDDLRRYPSQPTETRRLYDYTATSADSDVSTRTIQALDDRAMELRDNFRNEVSRYLPRGQNDEPLGIEDIDDTITFMRRWAQASYGHAVREPIDYSYKDRVFPSMLRRWERAAGARAGSTNAALRRAIEGFRTPDGQPVQTLQQLQDARRELRLMRTSARQQGDRVFLDASDPIYNQVTRMMRRMSPAWSRANDQWRDMEFTDMANRFGEGFTKRAGPRYRADLAEFELLDPRAQNIVRVQVMQQLFDKLDNVNDPYAIGRFFENPQIRRVITDLYGRDAVNQFTRAVRNISTAEKTFRMNSMTQPRQALAREMRSDQDAAAAGDLMSLRGIKRWAVDNLTNILVAGRDRPLADILNTRVSDVPETAMRLEQLRGQANRNARWNQPRPRGRTAGAFAVPSLAAIGQEENR